MSREYKFRAWLKKENRMVEVEEINFEHQFIQYKQYKDDEIGYDDKYVDFDDIELMQYIDKKDANNTIICDGDIVIYAIRSVSGYCEATGIVKYNKETCAYEVEDIEDIDCTEILGYCEDLKVIGNIYENPELLEGCEDSENDCQDFDIIDEDFGLLLDQLSIDPLKP